MLPLASSDQGHPLLRYDVSPKQALAAFKSGAWPLEVAHAAPDGTPSSADRALDLVLAHHGLGVFSPGWRAVCDFLVAQGQDPWDGAHRPPGFRSRTADALDAAEVAARGSTYDFLSQATTHAQAMAWCWGLPTAPRRVEPTVGRQVRRDAFVGELRDRRWMGPAGLPVIERFKREGGDLFEPWSDGLRPLDQVLALACPHERAATAGKQSRQDRHEWLDLLRSVARIGRQVMGDPRARQEDLLAVRAVLWAWASYPACQPSLSSEEPLRGVLRQYDRDLAKALEWPEKDAALRARAHAATTIWIQGRTGFAAARLGMEFALARTRAEPVNQPLASRAPVLLEMAAFAARAIADHPLPPAVPIGGMEAWKPWEQAWASIALESGRPGLPPEILSDPRLWLLALPTWGFTHATADNTWHHSQASIMDAALKAGNPWPAIPGWQQVVARHPFGPASVAALASRRWDAQFPAASARTWPRM